MLQNEIQTNIHLPQLGKSQYEQIIYIYSIIQIFKFLQINHVSLSFLSLSAYYTTFLKSTLRSYRTMQ